VKFEILVKNQNFMKNRNFGEIRNFREKKNEFFDRDRILAKNGNRDYR